MWPSSTQLLNKKSKNKKNLVNNLFWKFAKWCKRWFAARQSHSFWLQVQGCSTESFGRVGENTQQLVGVWNQKYEQLVELQMFRTPLHKCAACKQLKEWLFYTTTSLWEDKKLFGTHWRLNLGTSLWPESIRSKQVRRLGAGAKSRRRLTFHSRWQRWRMKVRPVCWPTTTIATAPPATPSPPLQRRLAPAFQVLTVFIKQSSVASQLEGRGMSGEEEGRKKKNQDAVMKEKKIKCG